jgi:hypothetical protein
MKRPILEGLTHNNLKHEEHEAENPSRRLGLVTCFKRTRETAGLSLLKLILLGHGM